MTIIGTLVFMFIYDWKITMVVVLVTPASFFIASFIAKEPIICLRSSRKRGASRLPLLMK